MFPHLCLQANQPCSHTSCFLTMSSWRDNSWQNQLSRESREAPIPSTSTGPNANNTRRWLIASSEQEGRPDQVAFLPRHWPQPTHSEWVQSEICATPRLIKLKFELRVNWITHRVTYHTNNQILKTKYGDEREKLTSGCTNWKSEFEKRNN
jgi:hypothetical protein